MDRGQELCRSSGVQSERTMFGHLLGRGRTSVGQSRHKPGPQAPADADGGGDTVILRCVLSVPLVDQRDQIHCGLMPAGI